MPRHASCRDKETWMVGCRWQHACCRVKNARSRVRHLASFLFSFLFTPFPSLLPLHHTPASSNGFLTGQFGKQKEKAALNKTYPLRIDQSGELDSGRERIAACAIKAQVGYGVCFLLSQQRCRVGTRRRLSRGAFPSPPQYHCSARPPLRVHPTHYNSTSFAASPFSVFTL